MSWGGFWKGPRGLGAGQRLILVLPSVKQEPAAPAASPKPTLSEEELEKKSKAIIEEYLHINDMKVRAAGGRAQHPMAPP